MFPQEVMTRTKKGKLEVRSLSEKGEFLLYEFLDPETTKPTSNKKKLILKSSTRRSEFFLIPTRDGRFLLIPTEPKEGVKVWADGSIVEF